MSRIVTIAIIYLPAVVALVCAGVFVYRGEAFPAAAAGLVAGDMMSRAHIARREALER